MSARTIVWAAILVALIVVLGVAAVRAFGAMREVRTLKRRVDALGDLPIVGALEKAQRDVERLQTLGERVTPLAERAALALAALRRNPIPPDLRAAALRIVTEVQELQTFVPRSG
ncbi:MAG: hypothetical protein JOZ24_03915 [Candidatus Eremiobacteraeota bacterium]|nr:hypothetical protein [Candidatus Eremiobacteraeota bacterium]